MRFEPLEQRRLLALVTVTTDQDVVDFNDGVTSLREAIFATNIVPGADTINFDFGHDGPATILLTQGELRISDSLTIIGPGANLLTIDASGNDPTPDVNNGDGSRILYIDNDTKPNGGISQGSQISIPDTESIFSFLDVSISGLTLTGGDLASHGGAIFSRENLELVRVEIRQNAAAASGGGIAASYGTLSVRDTTITANSAGDGGGVRMGVNSITGTDPTLNIINSTISGNQASTYGDGVSLFLSSVHISHSTITANAAQYRPDSPSWGGGIWADARESVVDIDHSIVAGNIDELGNPSDAMFNPSPVFPVPLSVTSSIIGFNTSVYLQEAPIGSPDANGNLIGGPMHGEIDPLLGPLANNGGQTMTHALLAGSPAINRGDLNAVAGQGGVPLFDQRGEPFGRIFGGRIDIGAFEYQESSDLNLLVDTLADESDGDYSRYDLSLREAIELANLYDGHDTIRFDPILWAQLSPLPSAIVLTMGELVITDEVTRSTARVPTCSGSTRDNSRGSSTSTMVG